MLVMGLGMKKVVFFLFKYFHTIIMAFLRLFFSQKYLQTKPFLESHDGFIWAFRSIWQRSILRLGKPLPFPASIHIRITNPENLIFHPDDLNNFQGFGCYFQCFDATITIGQGTYIAPNVGLVTSNHDLNYLRNHAPGEPINIGKNCWIGMNSVILPGVNLGESTIVAAGSVVSKSYPEGSQVIGGVPAKPLKPLKMENGE